MCPRWVNMLNASRSVHEPHIPGAFQLNYHLHLKEDYLFLLAASSRSVLHGACSFAVCYVLFWTGYDLSISEGLIWILKP